MILHLLLAVLQEPVPAPHAGAPTAGCPAGVPAVPECAGQQGEEANSKKIAWFSGSWEECLAEAQRTNRIIFVDLWMPWCPYCKKMDALTFSDPSVLSEMRELVPFSVNTTDPSNAKLVRRFKTGAPPALVFLEPSGELRDVLSGYIPPKVFLDELRRVKRNERTLTDLRSRISRDERDLEARYDLALKMKEIGDVRGYKKELETIRVLDPKGHSVPARLLKLEQLQKAAELALEPRELYSFLAQEKSPVVLFEGWYDIWQLEGYLTRVASTEEGREEHRKKTFEAARKLWPYVPKTHYARIGNNIAWSYYEGREYLSPADLEWALGVAAKVAEVVPDEAYVIDTLACCLFAVGRREDALREIQRCIELEPLNYQWKERLHQFESAPAETRVFVVTPPVRREGD